MNRAEIEAINRERLEVWRRDLNEAHATPLLLVGVSHGQRSGEMHVITVEELSDEVIATFMQKAVKMLKARLAQGRRP